MWCVCACVYYVMFSFGGGTSADAGMQAVVTHPTSWTAPCCSQNSAERGSAEEMVGTVALAHALPLGPPRAQSRRVAVVAAHGDGKRACSSQYRIPYKKRQRRIPGWVSQENKKLYTKRHTEKIQDGFLKMDFSRKQETALSNYCCTGIVFQIF